MLVALWLYLDPEVLLSTALKFAYLCGVALLRVLATQQRRDLQVAPKLEKHTHLEAQLIQRDAP